MKITEIKLKDFLKPEVREQIRKTAETWEQTYKKYKELPEEEMDLMTLLKRGEKAGVVTERGLVAKQKLEKAKVWVKKKQSLLLGSAVLISLGLIFFITIKRR